MPATKKKQQPLKVLHICGSHNRVGTEKNFLRLIHAQASLPDYEVLPLVAEGSWLASRLEERGRPFKTAPFKRGFKAYFDRTTCKEIEQAITDFGPDVIQNWAGRWSHFMPKTRQPKVARVGLFSSVRYIKNADYIVATTKNLFTFLAKKEKQENKIHYIPTFVNIPPKGFEDFRYDVRIEYNIPYEAHLVLLLGRLHEGKGFDIALFALNMLPQNVHMLIVGEGPEHGRLLDAVHADGQGHRAHFAGWIDNTSPFFAAADSFLLPSRNQSSCNVILEAWAHKLPVICTDIPAVKALVTPGENAVVIPPEDDVAVGKALQALVDDKELRLKLAQKGNKHVHDAYSQKIVMQAYDKLYRQAIVEKKRKR